MSDNQNLHTIISYSRGFIDVFVVDVDQQVPALLPQSLVLAALNAQSDDKAVLWRERPIPVWSLLATGEKRPAVALIVEGEKPNQRLALLTDEMPETKRLRISEVVDCAPPKSVTKLPHVYQYVKIENEIYQVPNFSFMEHKYYRR